MYAHDGHGCTMHQQVAGLSHWVTKILTSLSAHGSYFVKKFREPTLVDMRVILRVEDDKMVEYIHPHTELETLRVLTVYMCMHMMGMDATCINK